MKPSSDSSIKLYDYYRSSAAYRVRIALNLKGIDYQQFPVNLLAGDQHSKEYLAVNQQGLVPALQVGQGCLIQSLAILEWLEREYPEPSLLPTDPWQAAQLRSVAHIIACDIHPLNNLRVLNYLVAELGATDDKKMAWYRHWLKEGFLGIEPLLTAKPFACGDKPSLADVVLVPQIYNAKRFGCDLSVFPKIQAVDRSCQQLQAFSDARPENQPDAI